MIYVKWRWFHSFLDEPVLIFAELDDDRWLLREVAVFSDGRREYQDGRGTVLSEMPYDSNAEINAADEFQIEFIEEKVFAAEWKKACEEGMDRNGAV